MNLLGAILLVSGTVLMARVLPLGNRVHGIYDRFHEVLSVMGDNHRTDSEKGKVIRSLSLRLLVEFLLIIGMMTLALLAPTLGLLLLAETETISLSGVWNWLVRLDFQLVTLLIGAVWYGVRIRDRGGFF